MSIRRYYSFTCDNVTHVPVFNELFPSIKSARLAGWVISHDRSSCYCPACANYFKYCGKNGNANTIFKRDVIAKESKKMFLLNSGEVGE